ncbi:MFS transporter [Methanohalophilus halophilus]|uniref:MFS transporter n=1 Tax=Methanohalophilus halophilus TaxID=2177 RepID=A0A1L3Q144_9EURY|nr:MFS transporter [Methanohalophilus halophilus]APH38575.1 MFS transporter [Methanohalophilus halophilus]RNI08429.1 MFS transporter [Methanohalophilus halophilus]SDW15279.1 Predicted arabinose efflux permease, MFS family [Methanohalophilus halophilus]
MTDNFQDQYSKFLYIWFGQFISIIGTGLTIFALGVYVYQLTGTASSYVFILMCAFLPPILLKPYGGILADRHDRRIMMVFGDLGSTLGLLFIFFMMVKGNIELWQVYLGISVSSIFSAFQEPAYKALVTDLLTRDQYAKASGLMQLASSAQYLLSPLLAGVLLSLLDIKFIFLIDVSTLLIASFIVIWIRNILGEIPVNRQETNFMEEFKEGFQEFSKNTGVVHLVITTMIILFFVGLLQSLFVPMLLNLESVKTVGISQSLCASGMIIGSLFIGIFGSRSGHVTMLSIALFLSGLFFAGLGLSANIILITLAGFLFFAMLPFINTPIEVLIRTNIDNQKQGRVWSIISTTTYVGSILAFAVAGFLADALFDPLLKPDGVLADSIGFLIGTGSGRGIAFMFIVAGLMISIISLFIWKNSRIKRLEDVEKQNRVMSLQL